MIPVQNVYYMLSYAFKVLNEQGYKRIATEEFNNTAELMAAILAKGIAVQLKRGLGKEYISQTEELSSLRGKIDIAESIKTQSMIRKKLICTYDDFSVNSTMNRIIKSTVEVLLKADIEKSRKKELRKLMVFFADVMDEGYEEFSTSVRQLSDAAKRWTSYKRIQDLSKVNSPYVKQEIQKIFSGEYFQCRDEYELLRAVHMIDVHAFYAPLKKELLNNMDFSSNILKLDRAQLRKLLNYLENHSGYHLEELQNLIYKLMDEFMSVYQSLIPAFLV